MGSRLRVFLLAAALAVSPVAGADIRASGSPSAAAMGFDLLMARPAGFVSTVLGGGLFVVSLPFSAAGGNVGAAADRLVTEPAKFTFVRPLGAFDEVGRSR